MQKKSDYLTLLETGKSFGVWWCQVLISAQKRSLCKDLKPAVSLYVALESDDRIQGLKIQFELV